MYLPLNKIIGRESLIYIYIYIYFVVVADIRLISLEHVIYMLYIYVLYIYITYINIYIYITCSKEMSRMSTNLILRKHRIDKQQ